MAGAAVLGAAGDSGAGPAGEPQKALRGGIPGDGFGIWGRFWSHFEGKSRQKMTDLSGIDF